VDVQIQYLQHYSNDKLLSCLIVIIIMSQLKNINVWDDLHPAGGSLKTDRMMRTSKRRTA